MQLTREQMTDQIIRVGFDPVCVLWEPGERHPHYPELLMTMNGVMRRAARTPLRYSLTPSDCRSIREAANAAARAKRIERRAWMDFGVDPTSRTYEAAYTACKAAWRAVRLAKRVVRVIVEGGAA